MNFTHMCMISQLYTLSCGSGHPSLCGSEGGCTVDTPHLQPAPSPSSGTCVHVVTRPAAAESVFASLDLMLDPRGQGLEGTVVEMVHSKSQVVVAVNQMKGHLLHVTSIPTNNHYTNTIPLGSAPKCAKKRYSLRICLLLLQALLKENH